MAKVTVIDNGYSIESLYKWDTGQELEIYGMTLPVAPQVHFAHKGDQFAIVRQASMDASGVIRVSIPDIMLQSTARLCAYICTQQGEEFKTLCKIVIPVIPRAKPNDYAPDEEAYVYALAGVDMEIITLEPDDTGKVEKVLDGDKVVLRFSIPRGPAGPTPQLRIGTVETLDPTQKATAEITGTPENPILHLGIPSGEAASADMAVNDPAKTGYVKNRTHWKEVVGVDGIIIPETTATFSQNGIASVVGVADGLVEGGKYVFTMGGAVLESRCKKVDDGWYVGNGSLYLDSLENTGEALCIYSSGDTVYTIFNRHKIPGSTTFTMRGVRETIWHKLDDGYMPDPVVLALGDHGIDLEAIVNAGGSAVVEYTSLLWAAVSDAWQSGNRLRVSVPVGNTELVFSDPTVCKVDNDGLCLLMNTMLTLDTSFVALYIMLSPDVSGGTVNTAKTTVYAKSVLLG